MKTVRLIYRCMHCSLLWDDSVEIDEEQPSKQLEVQFNGWHACRPNFKGRSELVAMEYEEPKNERVSQPD